MQTMTAGFGLGLALTWLNLNVHLDTVVLLGSVAVQHEDRLNIAIGAMTASFVFFLAP